ncbi:MAG: S-layer homology domain-containing protein [Oscillospiraceae bacterium]|nr:S-layer homology domain-containing protein [Oscillospiraceae bacterium]
MKRTKNIRRTIALLLVLIMVASILPMSALAEYGAEHVPYYDAEYVSGNYQDVNSKESELELPIMMTSAIGQVFVSIADPTPTPDGENWPAARGLMAEGWVNLYEADSARTVIGRLAAANELAVEGDAFINSIGGLSSGDRGGFSGWMGLLNDWFTNEGFTQFTVANGGVVSGDTIAVMFSLEMGADIGGSWENNDKTLGALQVSVGTLLDAAIATHDDSNATQAQVDAAADNLRQAINALVRVGNGGNQQPGGQYPGGQPPTTITVTFSLFGVPQHDGAPRYIWRTNSAAFQTWIAPRTFTFNTAHVTVADVFQRALQEAGFEATITSQGNYVARIRGPQGWIGEFDNGTNSGWMYMLNGVHTGLGLAEQNVQNGDVIIWHFTDDFTQEAGGTNWGTPPGGVGGVGGARGAAAVPEDEDEEAELPNVDIPLAELSVWESQFRDVRSSDWFYESVRFANTLGIMQGVSDDMFAPNTPLSRAMIVTMLWRLQGEPVAAGANVFPDVVGGRWYTDAISWAAENGIVQGHANGLFAPNDDITREQLAAILMRYADWQGMDATATSNLAAFVDSGQVSEWAREAVSWANAEGLITGRTETMLAPRGNATRAEAATILMRFITELVR